MKTNKNYMYDYELFKQGKHYIRLETKEKYDRVMQELEELGFRWNSGSKPTYFDMWSAAYEILIYTYRGTMRIRNCTSGGGITNKNLKNRTELQPRIIFTSVPPLTIDDSQPIIRQGYLKYNEHYGDLDTFTVMRNRVKYTPLDPYEFSLAFNINKYVERIGKKDDKLKELNKIKSYVDEWIDYLKEKGEIE